MGNFIPASPTLSLQKTERRGWGTPVWVGHSLRLRSGQALSDAFHFFFFGGANKSHQDSKQIKVRDGQLHSGISHPVSPKNGETRVRHPCVGRTLPSVTCLICECWIRFLQVDLEVEHYSIALRANFEGNAPHPLVRHCSRPGVSSGQPRRQPGYYADHYTCRGDREQY